MLEVIILGLKVFGIAFLILTIIGGVVLYTCIGSNLYRYFKNKKAMKLKEQENNIEENIEN